MTNERRLEQGVADGFNGLLHDAAAARRIRSYSLSLGAQDRDTGGDYLLSDSSRFALIEFKYQAANVLDEKRKGLRLKLCLMLPDALDMMALHDRCHFIGWRNPETERVETNIYRHEVCNCHIFGPSSGLQAKMPHAASRVSAKQFIGEFLDGDGDGGARTLDLEDFERYLGWLKVQVSGSDEATLQLLVRDPSYPDDYVSKRFLSLSEAYRWMQNHKPTQTSDDDPEDRPSPFRMR